MKINNNSHKGIALRIFVYSIFLLFALLISFREPSHISDGLSYVEHASLNDIDFSRPDVYGYSFYWILVSIFGGLFGYYFPSFLSFVVFFLVFLVVRKLSTTNFIIFVSLLLINPLIFNSMFVALKNGLALSVLMYGILNSSKLYSFGSMGFHPGVALISFFSTILDKNLSKILMIFTAILIIVIVTSYSSILTDVLNSRGYENEETGKELWFVYLIYIVLGALYYFSFKENPYKYYFILLVLFWIFIGYNYSFAWRVFSQGLTVGVLILLVKGDNPRPKFLFLFLFLFVSLFSAYKWHPLVEYREGWLDYWLTFI